MVDILFFPHPIGIAHVMRSYLIARELSSQFSVAISYNGDYRDLINNVRLVESPQHDYNYNDYLESLERQRYNLFQFPFGDKQRLEQIIKEEVEIIGRLQPSLLIGDTRLSLMVSSNIAELPYISIQNANMTPFFREIPPNVKKDVEKSISFYNEILEDNQLDNNVKSFYDILHGDLNLIVDSPLFMPLPSDIPKEYVYVGPVLWSSNNTPSWLSEVENKRSNGKRFAYVTFGGTGNVQLMNKVYTGLKKRNYGMIASLGKLINQFSFHDSDVYTEPFLGSNVMDLSDVTICHGGNSTIYLSILHNSPIIGIPSNPEQVDNVNQAIVNKLGIGFYESCLSPYDIAVGIDYIEGNNYFSNTLSLFSSHLSRLNGAKNSANKIKEFIEKI